MSALARQVEHHSELPDGLGFRAVERRVMRACKTVRALPDRERRFLHGGSLMNSIWRQSVDEFQAYAAQEERIRFIPKPYDVSDFLVALSWCNILTKSEFRYIWWRSFDSVSFAVIAGRIGRSDETARRRYEDSMRKVWYEAITSNNISIS